MMNFKITPARFLQEIGLTFANRGAWLSLKTCPYCEGGLSRDVFTFAVHATDGNYFCHRAKCGVKGSFWKLIESQGKNPRHYAGGVHGVNQTSDFQKPKKRYIYGR